MAEMPDVRGYAIDAAELVAAALVGASLAGISAKVIEQKTEDFYVKLHRELLEIASPDLVEKFIAEVRDLINERLRNAILQGAAAGHA